MEYFTKRDFDAAHKAAIKAYPECDIVNFHIPACHYRSYEAEVYSDGYYPFVARDIETDQIGVHLRWSSSAKKDSEGTLGPSLFIWTRPKLKDNCRTLEGLGKFKLTDFTRETIIDISEDNVDIAIILYQFYAGRITWEQAMNACVLYLNARLNHEQLELPNYEE